MDGDKQLRSGRLLTILVGIATVTSSLVSIPLFYQLPHKPWSLILPYTLYAAFATLLGALGLAGTLRRKASYVAAFSNYLILDTLCMVPRMLLLIPLLGQLEDFYCPYNGTGGMGGASAEALMPIDRPPNVTERFEAWLREHGSRRECRLVLWVAVAQAAAIVVGALLVQWWITLRIREYAIRLARLERVDDRPAAREGANRPAEEKLDA